MRASVTYNHLVEGTLALTGYLAWRKICTERDILPGMQRLVRLIGDDERRHMAWRTFTCRRHMAWRTFTCRRHVAADDANWQVVTDRMGELLPHAIAQIQHVMDAYEPNPFELTMTELVAYASNRAGRRLGAIESARGADLATIDVDVSPEQLEEQFSAEDDRELTAGVG